jgi:hypothetical protein
MMMVMVLTTRKTSFLWTKKKRSILTGMVLAIMPIRTMITMGRRIAEDAFPLDAKESIDTDGDGKGNNADTDDDNDKVSDKKDKFPLDANVH